MRVVSFRVGAGRFALPADVVSEVVEAGRIIDKLPGVSDQRLGLTRVRGNWIPVIELSRLLEDIEATTYSEHSFLLLLEGERGPLGLRVEDFGELTSAGRYPPPGGSGGVELVELNGELVRLLDPAALQLAAVGREGGSMNESLAGREDTKIVVFRLGADAFGLDVLGVAEVIRLPDVRRVPGAPEFIEGVASLNSGVLPIIDMRKRFSLPAIKKESSQRLVVVSMGEGRVGLVVDSVPGVIPLASDDVSAPPPMFRGLAARFVEGLADIGNRLIILLDIERILDTEERIALQQLVDGVAADEAGGGD